MITSTETSKKKKSTLKIKHPFLYNKAKRKRKKELKDTQIGKEVKFIKLSLLSAAGQMSISA